MLIIFVYVTAPIEKFSKANIAYDVNTQEYAGQAETIMGKLLSLLFQFAFPNGLEKDVRGTIQTDKFPLPGGSKPIRPIISDLI